MTIFKDEHKYCVLVIQILDIIIKLIMMMIYSVSNYHRCVLTCKHTCTNV